MSFKSKLVAILVAGAFSPIVAYATNGYAPNGLSIKSSAMGGVGYGIALDALAAAANPAGMVWVGDRMDVGVTWFRPVRDADIVGNAGPINGHYDGSGKKDFFLPEFGYNRMINPNLSVGVSVFGNGGLNTQYNNGIPLFANPQAFGQQRAGVDLMQLFVAPTVAFKVTPQHSIGASVNIIYSRFKAEGLQNFTATGGPPQQFSQFPGDVTNRGYDDAWGWSVRVGYLGEIAPGLFLGASYQTESDMGKFKKYQGLFAEGGNFDVPENYGLGLSWRATPALTLAADVQFINYSKVKAVGNGIDKLFAGNPLGSDNGPGFKWDDMTVYKLGMSYDVSPQWTVRAGYSFTDQPIPRSDTLFNMLAPAVIDQHVSLGATWKIDPKSELSFAYVHAFENEVKGSGSIPPNFGGGEANIKMYQDSFGVSYGMRF